MVMIERTEKLGLIKPQLALKDPVGIKSKFEGKLKKAGGTWFTAESVHYFTC